MSNEEFIRRLYQEILGRPPDKEGGKYWVNALNTGLFTQENVTAQFTQAPEVRKSIRNRVIASYQNILGRQPDQGGLDFWMERFTSGELFPSTQVIEASFRQSEEYARNGGVDKVYVAPGRTISEPHPDAIGDGTNDSPTAMPDQVDDTIDLDDTGYNRENVKVQIDNLLKRYDLEGLSQWVNDMLDQKAPFSRVEIELQDQQVFKDRFPAMEMQRQNGMPVMSAEQYLTYETTARQLMRQAGLPQGFYDEPGDFTNLIANDVSPAELSQRVQNVYLRAVQAPPEVKARYATMFGVNGEGALAAQILDPDKALPVLEQQVAAAEIAGFGDVFGVNIDQNRATRLAELGYSGQTSMTGFRQVQEDRALFQESVTETQDLTAEGEGVDRAFGLDQDSADTIERRRASRVNALSGGGGLNLNQEGLAGRADQ
jgi:hypothetical protein